jgi:threonine dehydrogenase-like Zn-dependent dehydrogenase
MKTIVCTEPFKFEYQNRQEPEPIQNCAIIRIKRVGVCGTDLHAFEGTQPFLSYPRILGHELAGELVSFDHAPGFQLNESVSFIPYFNCGTCIACRNGKPNCCVHLQVCGVHMDGGMAEYISVPSGSLLHGQGLSLDELALIEPLSIGAHGVWRAGIVAGEFVLVIGAGPIGLGTMEFARIAGANVIALDVNEHRLQFCKEKLHLKYIINGSRQDAFEQIRDITNGDMPTVVFDATGNLGAINHAFQYMAHGARYVLIGLQRGDIVVNHPEFHKREGSLLSSRNATRKDFEQVIDAIRRKDISPLDYITHRAQFDGVSKVFESWLNPNNHVIKAMIELD